VHGLYAKNLEEEDRQMVESKNEITLEKNSVAEKQL
jgi:hypothetical protein